MERGSLRQVLAGGLGHDGDRQLGRGRHRGGHRHAHEQHPRVVPRGQAQLCRELTQVLQNMYLYFVLNE